MEDYNLGDVCVMNPELSYISFHFSSPFPVESGGKGALEVPADDPDLRRPFERL